VGVGVGGRSPTSFYCISLLPESWDHYGTRGLHNSAKKNSNKNKKTLCGERTLIKQRIDCYINIFFGKNILIRMNVEIF
jgi:hypothetical protein